MMMMMMMMMMMDLPERVVFEILLRLPVLSLLRFKSVCKDWFALINSSVFEEKHLAYQIARDDESLILVNMCYHWRDHKNQVGSYYKNYMTCYRDYESFLAGDSKASYSIDIQQAAGFSTHINGIVCIINYNCSIYLLNPALREIRAIPEPLYDNYNSSQAVGLGYDDSTKDYILVQILRDDDNYCPCGCTSTSNNIFDEKCFLYHLETDTWTVVEMPEFMMTASLFYIRSYFSETFFQGSIHWCIEEMKDEVDPEPNHRILTFNTTSKLFQEIEFPHDWKDHYYNSRPGLYKVDNSCLALVAECKQVVNIWVMKEYGVAQSWTKQYSINCSSSYMRPLCLLKTDRLFLGSENGKKTVCYDLSDRPPDVWYDISKGEIEENDFQPYSQPLQVVTCYESLVSIKKSSKLKKEKRESYNRHDESRSHPFPPQNLLFL